MKFLIVSDHGDGVGVAHRLQAEGNEVALYFKKPFARSLMAGIIPQVRSLREGVDQSPDVIVFDMAGMGVEADKLKSDGWKVLGAGKWNDRLELDRAFADKTMKTFGIRSPESYAFDSMKEALRFVSEHPRRLVLKPFDNKNPAFTYVGQSQDELMAYMAYLKKTLGVDGKFLLQEFIRGTEISTEIWFSNGKPVPYPNGTIELKKMMHGDAGASTGSETSLVWVYPKKEPKIVQQSLKKLFVFMEHIRYTGPLDINGIVRNGRFYGLEFSPRMGYSAIHALMQVLAEDLGEVLYRVASGDPRPIKYREGFGFALRVSIPPYPYRDEDENHNKMMYAKTQGIMVGGVKKSEWGRRVLCLDVRDSRLGPVTAGVDGAVMDVCSFGETPWIAEITALEIFKRIELPQKQARLGDAAKIADRRFMDLEAMGYEIPPLFVQQKAQKENIEAVALPTPPPIEKEKTKDEKPKDDRLAIANAVGSRPGAIASPVQRGR